jgi:hypothetical protein
MSLLVSIIPKQKGDALVETLEAMIVSPYNNLFGVESWRKRVWGHEFVRVLDCPILCSLKEGDVHVFDEDILTLKAELEILMEYLEQLSYETSMDEESLEFRIKNALEAIRVVMPHRNKVGIALW